MAMCFGSLGLQDAASTSALFVSSSVMSSFSRSSSSTYSVDFVFSTMFSSSEPQAIIKFPRNYRSLPLVRQECERQKCERHQLQCEANSANANSAKGSTARMRQECECQMCECQQCDATSVRKKVRQQCECKQCESHFFLKLLILISDLDGTEKKGASEKNVQGDIRSHSN